MTSRRARAVEIVMTGGTALACTTQRYRRGARASAPDPLGGPCRRWYRLGVISGVFTVQQHTLARYFGRVTQAGCQEHAGYGFDFGFRESAVYPDRNYERLHVAGRDLEAHAMKALIEARTGNVRFYSRDPNRCVAFHFISFIRPRPRLPLQRSCRPPQARRFRPDRHV